MLTTIFADNAPRYWAKGLPVIPLRPMEKKPIPAGWSVYADSMPTKEEQDAWLSSNPHANIGMVLGKQSKLVMIDIDTDDGTIMQALMDILQPFPSPWKRIGKKGMAIAYRQPPGMPLKTFRLKQAGTNKTLVEVLSSGTQLVLPPSIHPETKRPYEANCDLIEVYDQIPMIPADIESMFRSALERLGISLSASGMGGLTEFVSVGNRDNKMTSVAGLLAQDITRGHITFIEAQARLEAWVSSFVQQVAGDPLDIKKGVQSLCGFLVKDVMVNKKSLPKGWDEGLKQEDKDRLGLKFEHEYEEWSFEEIRNYIQLQHETHGAGTSQWNDTIVYVLERLARSTSLDTIAIENILRYISETSGGKITIAVLRNRMKEIKQGDLKGQDHSEIAEKVIEDIEQYGELRYADSRFWQWSGSHWEQKDEDEILRHISSNYGNLAAAKRRSDHVGIVKTMMSTVSKPLQTVNIPGVNFANGYLTEDLKLVQHDKEYGCRYTLPYRYLEELGKETSCSKFQAFLDRSFIGDEDAHLKKQAVQEALAITLFGLGPQYVRAILLFGPAKTGKSELLKIVESLLPDEVKSALPPDQWGETFGPSQLSGKLLNIAGELSGTRKIDGATFKKIVDGTSITGQFKGQQLFTFKPACTHWFGSNHTPKTDDTSTGFLRRWLILRFNHPITDAEKVPNIAMRIVSEEREAIVAWAVNAMLRLKEQHEYTIPPSHVDWIEEVACANNSVRYFMKQSGLVRTTSAPVLGVNLETCPYITETKLFESFSTFSMIAGVAQRVGLKPFRMAMIELSGELGFQVRTVSLKNGAPECRFYGLTFVEPARAA